MKVGDEWMIIKICSMLLSQCTFVQKYSLIVLRYCTVKCHCLSVYIAELWQEITKRIFRTGVSCDSCLKNNFRGRRYKCLICIDYDLCAACYESGATTIQHTTEHPMQCILSRSDFGELSYPQFDVQKLTSYPLASVDDVYLKKIPYFYPFF